MLSCPPDTTNWQEDTANPTPGIWYFHGMSKTFWDAKIDCEMRGARLAMIKNEHDLTKVKSIIASNGEYHSYRMHSNHLKILKF